MWQLAIQGNAQGIWFWASLYALIVCACSLIFQIRTRFWHSTKGRLSDLAVEKLGATQRARSDQDYVSKALYRYNVRGVAYEGTRISPWKFVVSHNARLLVERQMASIQRFPDGTVTVFYHPDNPGKSFLIVAGKPGICITLITGLLPLITFYCKVLWVARFIHARGRMRLCRTTDIHDGQMMWASIPDNQGNIIAGLYGHTWGECCEITQLWVAESRRRKGLGRSLLQEVEAELTREVEGKHGEYIVQQADMLRSALGLNKNNVQ